MKHLRSVFSIILIIAVILYIANYFVESNTETFKNNSIKIVQQQLLSAARNQVKSIQVLLQQFETIEERKNVITEVVSNMHDGGGGCPWVINDLGTIIAHPDRDKIGVNILQESREKYPDCYEVHKLEYIIGHMVNGNEGMGFYHCHRGDEVVQQVLGYAPIRNWNPKKGFENRIWSFVVSIEYNTVTNPIEAYSDNIFKWSLFIMGFLGFAITIWFVLLFLLHKNKIMLHAQANELKEQKKIRKLFDALPFGTCLLTADKEIVEINDPALEIMRYDPGNFDLARKHLIGKPCNDVFCPNITCPIIENNICIDRSEKTLLDKNRKSVPILKSAIPITLDNEEYIFETFVDLTKIKEVEGILKAEKERSELLAKEAQIANISKSKFLATMSHEIRTPMNAIIGFSDILKFDDNLTEQQRDQVERINSAGRNLLGIINDILDISKVEAGKLDLEYVTCESSEILERIELYKARAQQNGIDFQCFSHLPKTVELDPTRVNQCITNLVSNALKFTKKGGFITIYCYEMDSCLYCDVLDSGIGIPKDKQHKIFDMFTQADSSTTRKYGGTGLGLSITKKLVNLMDGEIHMASEENSWTIFSLKIPIKIIDDTRVRYEPQECTCVDHQTMRP